MSYFFSLSFFPLRSSLLSRQPLPSYPHTHIYLFTLLYRFLLCFVSSYSTLSLDDFVSSFVIMFVCSFFPLYKRVFFLLCFFSSSDSLSIVLKLPHIQRITYILLYLFFFSLSLSLSLSLSQGCLSLTFISFYRSHASHCPSYVVVIFYM